MRPNTETGPPLICALGAGEARERLDWIAALNRTALLDARRDGRCLILTYRAGQADRIREVIRRESQCCSFLNFAVDEVREAVTLTITAPDSAPDILDSIFDPFAGRAEQTGACGCASGSACKGVTDDRK